jgi:aspartyl-tRNA(Asn)/glutamyl-tRNA(Gln) amidotransferase subunit A
MNDDILFGSVAELGQLLRMRQISSVELTAACLDRLETLGPQYNAVATVTRQLAEKQAQEADDKFQRKHIASPLQGIPFGVKDLLATKGIRTTWGSEPFADQVFDYDATVIRKLREAGAVLAAKLAMVPLASAGGYRFTDPHLFDNCKNPWNPLYWAGGSSSGPAAAVAGAMVPFAIGSETAGSIVVAAAYSGITGMRPTYGLVSRHGAMALSWTLDKLGPMCHSAEDCALVLGAIAGDDPNDPSSSGRNFEYPKYVGPAPRELRVGYWPGDFTESAAENARPAFAAALEVFRKIGVQMVEVKLPDVPYNGITGVIARTELTTVFESLIKDEARFNLIRDGEQKEGMKAGLDVRATQYLQATRIRRLIQEQFRQMFTQIDVLVSYTDKRSAPRMDTEPPDPPSTPGPPAGNTSLMSASNLAGLPGITVPCGFTSDTNLPLGLHLVGRPFEDSVLVAMGAEFQRQTDWHRRRPPMPKTVLPKAAS